MRTSSRLALILGATSRITVRIRHATFLAMIAGALTALAADPPAGEKPAPAKPPQVAQLIRLPLPITGSVDQQVKRAVEAVLRKTHRAGERPVIVLEFWPAHSEFGEGSDFSRAHALARYLSSRDASRVKTVAFLPRTIKGHAVLAAMACEEIVMAPDAQFGAAGIDEPAEEGIDPAVRSAYREIANRRRTVPPEVALGMLDRALEILKVETEISTEFVFRSDLEELRKKRAIRSEEVLIPAGELGLFTGRQARSLNFVKFLAADRRMLARALGVADRSLSEDPSLWGAWHPVRVMVKGVITPQLVASAQKAINDQIELEGANFICLWMDSAGGSLTDSITLASFLAGLDRARVRTVAYIPNNVRGDASLVAMACDEVVMGRNALLGGSGAQAFSPDDLRFVRELVRDNLAAKKSRSWSLAEALVDPSTTVTRYRHRASGLVEYFSADELAALPDADQWIAGKPVTRLGEPLRLRAPQAEELGLAQHVVGSFEQFKQIYGLTNDLALAEPGWASTLIDALAAPGVAMVLLVVGFAALYAEIHSPGIGVGGFIAGICFLLYFWSCHLEGTAGWLEVLLFAAGVSCVMLELFVFPGVAIFGLGGGVMILASLILASQTFVLPRNDYQFERVRDSLLTLMGTAVGVVVFGALMRKYLPHAPMLGHMVLEPPSREESDWLSHRESLVDFDDLLGQHGVTTTPLMPSGKARFGGQMIDVIAEGEAIPRGAAVVVTDVHGNRVSVRTV